MLVKFRDTNWLINAEKKILYKIISVEQGSGMDKKSSPCEYDEVIYDNGPICSKIKSYFHHNITYVASGIKFSTQIKSDDIDFTNPTTALALITGNKIPMEDNGNYNYLGNKFLDLYKVPYLQASNTTCYKNFVKLHNSGAFLNQEYVEYFTLYSKSHNVLFHNDSSNIKWDYFFYPILKGKLFIEKNKNQYTIGINGNYTGKINPEFTLGNNKLNVESIKNKYDLCVKLVSGSENRIKNFSLHHLYNAIEDKASSSSLSGQIKIKITDIDAESKMIKSYDYIMNFLSSTQNLDKQASEFFDLLLPDDPVYSVVTLNTYKSYNKQLNVKEIVNKWRIMAKSVGDGTMIKLNESIMFDLNSVVKNLFYYIRCFSLLIPINLSKDKQQFIDLFEFLDVNAEYKFDYIIDIISFFRIGVGNSNNNANASVNLLNIKKKIVFNDLSLGISLYASYSNDNSEKEFAEKLLNIKENIGPIKSLSGENFKMLYGIIKKFMQTFSFCVNKNHINFMLDFLLCSEEKFEIYKNKIKFGNFDPVETNISTSWSEQTIGDNEDDEDDLNESGGGSSEEEIKLKKLNIEKNFPPTCGGDINKYIESCINIIRNLDGLINIEPSAEYMDVNNAIRSIITVSPNYIHVMTGFEDDEINELGLDMYNFLGSILDIYANDNNFSYTSNESDAKFYVNREGFKKAIVTRLDNILNSAFIQHDVPDMDKFSF